QSGQVKSDNLLRREIRTVQATTDFVQSKAKLPQGENLLQPRDVGGCIEPISRPAVRRWLQESNLVIVVKRSDCEPRPIRHFSNPDCFASHSKTLRRLPTNCLPQRSLQPHVA